MIQKIKINLFILHGSKLYFNAHEFNLACTTIAFTNPTFVETRTSAAAKCLEQRKIFAAGK